MKPNVFTRVIIEASPSTATFERSVVGIIVSDKGSSEYDVAMNISLSEPSPSNNVVTHQFAMHQSASGTTTVAI